MSLKLQMWRVTTGRSVATFEVSKSYIQQQHAFGSHHRTTVAPKVEIKKTMHNMGEELSSSPEGHPLFIIACCMRCRCMNVKGLLVQLFGRVDSSHIERKHDSDL